MKPIVKVLCLALFLCSLSATVQAQLLGISPSFPQINFVNTDPTAVSYDPNTQLFTVNAAPFDIALTEEDIGSLIVSNNTLQIQLNTDGTMASGTNGFVLTGQFSEVVGGVTNVYSGTLLQGDVVAFGWQYSGDVNQFDFKIQLTGGVIESLFTNTPFFGITMDSEASTFTGTFTNSFFGTAKGVCGPDDTIPPVITCPPLSSVTTTPATDASGDQGFIVTYPTPTVTDNSDPFPTVFCDIPSGSFVTGNPGDQITINCYGIDVSGNFSVCTLTVTLGNQGGGGMNGGTNGCPLVFINGWCPPVVLPTDLNSCSATYAFALPVATNCSGQSFVATATATAENGAAIPLTVLTNGFVQGVFPRTFTTNGDLITFTGTDGPSNVVETCQIFVNDTQAPNILCLNQAATFKPIVTNALSCISATFNNTCITASNYLWFSSVVQPVSCRSGSKTFTVHAFNQTIQLMVDNTNITLNVPDAYVVFSNGIPTATTTFSNGQWVTYSTVGCSGNTFLSGVQWQLPFNLNNVVGNCWGRDYDNGYFRRHVNSATWCARFAVDTAGVNLQWQWGAVVEKTLTTNYSTLCVKPVDDNYDSYWRNNDPAGACENYKSSLCVGACGRGYSYNGQPDCTGILSQYAPCNLGKGIVCEGPVYFNTPMAADNCDSSVKVTCTPPSGSIFGPGVQTITTTAVDSSGDSNTCTFTLTVLAPVQVVFDAPTCDNLADNTSTPDKGFNDFNCPDDPSTPEYVTCFHVGDHVTHYCRLLDCNGNDITTNLASCVTVHIDCAERRGSYANSVLVNNMTPGNTGAGTPGCIMIPSNGRYCYTLNTSGFPSRTVNTSTFFRSCVWVDYNSSPGVPIGMEDVVLQSQ